jgi:hypothetical protein
VKAFFDVEQYSDRWWELRRGVPTASEFARIITPKQHKLAAAHWGYLCKLIGERYSLQYPPIDRAVSEHMREGTRREPESRRWYEFEAGCDVRQVGFCLREGGRFGCSPDGLVGEDGLLQLKNPTPEVHVGYVLGGEVPAEYLPQCYGELFVTGREWLDFLSYCPGLPPFLRRIYPVGPFWRALCDCLEEFWSRYEEALARFLADGAGMVA